MLAVGCSLDDSDLSLGEKFSSLKKMLCGEVDEVCEGNW